MDVPGSLFLGNWFRFRRRMKKSNSDGYSKRGNGTLPSGNEKKLFVGCWEMIRIVPDATRCCRDACPLLRVEGRLNEAERERMFHFSLSDPASLPLSDFHSNSVTHQLPHFAFPGMFFSLSFGRRAHPACVTQTRLHPIRPLPLVRWNHHLDGHPVLLWQQQPSHL